MTDHASIHPRSIRHHEASDRPITVTMPDGRVLAFTDYDYTRGHPGSRMDPPTPAEVTINDAWWVESGADLTASELEAIHDGPAYDAILDAVDQAEGDRYWAAMADSSYAAMDDGEVE